jgi:hypothetical protein
LFASYLYDVGYVTVRNNAQDGDPIVPLSRYADEEAVCTLDFTLLLSNTYVLVCICIRICVCVAPHEPYDSHRVLIMYIYVIIYTYIIYTVYPHIHTYTQI